MRQSGRSRNTYLVHPTPISVMQTLTMMSKIINFFQEFNCSSFSHFQKISCLVKSKNCSFTSFFTDNRLLSNFFEISTNLLGPVVQSVVSLTSSLRVISLTVLAN